VKWYPKMAGPQGWYPVGAWVEQWQQKVRQFATLPLRLIVKRSSMAFRIVRLVNSFTNMVQVQYLTITLRFLYDYPTLSIRLPYGRQNVIPFSV